MPWLALPFENRKAKEELSNLLQVEGIPTLVMLDPSLKVSCMSFHKDQLLTCETASNKANDLH